MVSHASLVILTGICFGCCRTCLAVNTVELPTFNGQTIDLVCDRPRGIAQEHSMIWRDVNADIQLTRDDYVYPNIGALYTRVHISETSSTNEYNLQIIDAHESDAGMYQCGYELPQGTFVEIMTVNVVVLDSEITPECSSRILPSDGQVEGNEYDISCRWSRDLQSGQAVIFKNGRRIQPDVLLSGSVIARTVLTRDDIITCQLVVPVTSEIKTCKRIDLPQDGLKVRTDPHVAAVTVGDDVEFNCTAQADQPIESYTWKLRADAVFRFLGPTRGRFRTDDGSRRLTLLALEEEDDMLWVTCSVATVDGSEVTTMSVIHVLPSTIDPTRRDPQELPRRTTTPVPMSTTVITNGTSLRSVTNVSEVSTPLPVIVISVAAAGGLIAVLIIMGVVLLLIRALRRNSKQVDGNTVNTSWVMSTPEIDISDEVPEPRRFGRKKSRSSSRKFLYSRRSSKKKNRANGSLPNTSTGVTAHLAPPQIIPDPRGIYQNIPRSTSSSSLQSMHSRNKMRTEISHGYEDVKLEPPDVIRYKKPRPRNHLQLRPGDEGGYACIANPDEVPPIIYADLDLSASPPVVNANDETFDPSILYAKVKK